MDAAFREFCDALRLVREVAFFAHRNSRLQGHFRLVAAVFGVSGFFEKNDDNARLSRLNMFKKTFKECLGCEFSFKIIYLHMVMSPFMGRNVPVYGT